MSGRGCTCPKSVEGGMGGAVVRTKIEGGTSGEGASTTAGNRLDIVPRLVVGQSNGSLNGDPDRVHYWGRDEHPGLKWEQEEEDESGGLLAEGPPTENARGGDKKEVTKV